jgi:lysophospholipase L1-like esterase
VRWLLAVATVLFASSSSPGVSKPSVVFDGDSITVISTSAIHTLLDPSYNVEVLAVDGVRIDQSLSALLLALQSHPFAVVENLGTNDALSGGAHSNWMSSWDHLIQMTRTTSCVVLTTVGVAADAIYGHKPIAARINADIKRLAARDPKKFKVADWNGFLTGRPKGDWRTYVRADLIHPTAAGAVEIAMLDKKALDQCATGHSSKV